MLARGLVETFQGFPVQGVIKQDGPGGFALRSRPCHTGAHATNIQNVRVRRQLLVHRWREVLTIANQNAWTTYATNNPITKESGRVITLTGFNMYIHIQMTRLLAALAIVNVPPTQNLQPRATFISFAPLPLGLCTYQFVNSTAWTRSASALTVVFDRGVVSPTVHVRKQFGRVLAVHNGIPVVGHPLPYIALRPYTVPEGTGLILFAVTIRV